jgi:ubiquilin
MEPRELYRDQIAQMAEMGFTDEALCIRALQASGGNVQYAIERLFSGGM